MTNRQTCDLKQRILYIELISTKALLNLFNQCSLPTVVRNSNSLKIAVDYYKHYDESKESKESKERDFTAIDQQLETLLAELYQIRSRLWRQLEILLKYQPIAATSKRVILDKLDYQLDTILGLLNLDQSLPDNLRKNYENGLGQLIKIFSQARIAFLPWLQNFLNEKFSHAQRLLAIIQIYRTWQATLQKQIDNLPQQRALQLQEILTIKQLLYNQKSALLKSWLQQLTKSPDTLNDLLAKEILLAQQDNNNCFIAADLMRHLETQLTGLRATITQQENQLVQRYGWRQGISTGFLRMLTGNSYYELSATAFSSIESTLDSRSLQNVPLANVRLTKNYQRFFKTATAGTILAWELSEASHIGLPFLMVQSASRWLSNDFNAWCRLFKKLDKDEYDVVTSQEKIRLGVGFGIIITSQAARIWWQGLGWNWTLIGLSSGWYLAAVAGQKGLGKLIGWLLGGKQYQLDPMLNALCEYGGYSLGGASFMKALDVFWPESMAQSLSVQELLRNDELCKRHIDACHFAARQTIGATKNTPAVEIRAICRKLALEHHPDKGAVDEQITQINQACQILKR